MIHSSEPDVHVEIVTPHSQENDTGLRAWMNAAGEVVGATCPEDADLVIFQRPSFPQLVKSIPFFRARGVAVIVDIDDDLSNIDPRNPAFQALHPDPFALLSNDHVRQMLFDSGQHWPRGWKRTQVVDELLRGRFKLNSPHSWRAIEDAAKMATVVTVSTPALLRRYGSAGNAVVLPNCVPARFCDTPHVDSDVVGWPGSTHSHPGDLPVLGNSIARLGRGFKIIGAGPEADRVLRVPSVEETGPVAFEDWMPAVSTLGVGVAPLADTVFNQSKSWLKPLELSAAGVPWVASPRAEYERFHSFGAGVLADEQKAWHRELAHLVKDDAYRRERSEEARSVARRLTIEEHAWRTAEVWHRAVLMERAAGPRRTTPSNTYSTVPLAGPVAAPAGMVPEPV